MNSRSAELVELFSSIQGEGVSVGRRQAFLRLSGCNLDCRYCDTLHDAADSCRIEQTPGGRDFLSLPNPVSLRQVVERLAAWKTHLPLLHHSLSITGGEPLLHAELLAEWLPYLRAIFPIFLETNGVLSDELRTVIGHIDMISMDIKLPSTSGHRDLWRRHAAFLSTARQKECYVKIVVGTETPVYEVEEAAGLIAAIDRTIPTILQPVTAQLADPKIGEHLLSLQQAAAGQLTDVRVIPQIHAVLNVM